MNNRKLIRTFLIVIVIFTFSLSLFADSDNNDENLPAVYSSDSKPSWISKYLYDKDFNYSSGTYKSSKYRFFYVKEKSYQLHNTILLANFKAKKIIAEYLQTSVLSKVSKNYGEGSSVYKNLLAKKVRIPINIYSNMETYVTRKIKENTYIYIVYIKVSIPADKLDKLSTKLLSKTVK